MDKLQRNIEIESSINGSYIITQNGYLFQTISGTNKIGKTNLNNGKLEDEFELLRAKFSK